MTLVQTSFLLTADATCEVIERAGFRTVIRQDDTETAKAWIKQLRGSSRRHGDHQHRIQKPEPALNDYERVLCPDSCSRPTGR